MIRFQALVYDLDGTLVNSLEDIVESVNAVLVRHHRTPLPAATYLTLIGWGLRSLVSGATASRPFEEAEMKAVLDELKVEYARHPVHSTLYPGIFELVEEFSAKVPSGVLSNKEHAATVQVIDRLFPRKPFRTVQGAQPGIPHKPDPTSLRHLLTQWGVKPEATVYLGDSGVDMQTATAAGCHACGAAWGFRPRDELLAQGARIVFETPDSFRQWLETDPDLG